MGGVVNTVSNLVGDAVDFVASNPVVLAPLLGPEMFAADAAGGSFLGDVFAGDTLGSVITDAGVGGSFLGDASALGDVASGVGIGDIAFDGPTIPTDIPYDGPTTTGATSGVDQPFDGPTLPSSTPTGGIVDAVKGLIGQLTPSSTTVSNIFDSLSKAAPLAGAGVLGKLAYSDQARINQSITDAYNNYLKEQQGIRSGYGVTTGPQQLNYTMSGIPLARAPMRTAADVVNIPKKADGGILSKHNSNMLNEYMNLRNRLKKYKTGGRAHYAMGSSAMPMQQGMAPDREKLKELFTKRPDILKKVLALKAQHEAGSGQSSMGLKRGGIPEIDYRDKGGYVPPIGKKERADDIPAMLSNNEFVFTANAVRNAGGGDIKHGAKKMYALMKHLEKGMA